MSVVCFVSGDNTRLEKCLRLYAPQLTSSIIFILSKKPFKLGFDLAAKKIVSVDENRFREMISDFEKDIPGVSDIFQHGYGGLRNAGLFVASSLNQNLIFFYDDTAPTTDCISRYETLFENGKQIICGKYLNHAGGTTTILIELVATLEALKENRISASKAEEKLLDLLCGIPPVTKNVLSSAGFNGGNAGICSYVSSAYCFFPTEYRIEDGCYAHFSKYFLGETGFYNPQEENLLSKLPVVFHNKPRGSSRQLYTNLVSEIKGSVIAQFIDCVLSNSEPKITVESAAEKACTNFLLTFLREKITSENLDRVAADLKDEINLRLSEISSLTPANFYLPDTEIKNAINLFFFSQKNWATLVALSRKHFVEELLDSVA
jgi:hypothetical protein